MEVDTWVGASGKNGMRRDWIVRSYQTGQVLARATRHDFLHYTFNYSWIFLFLYVLIKVYRRKSNEKFQL